jgi:hypothetical protein
VPVNSPYLPWLTVDVLSQKLPKFAFLTNEADTHALWLIGRHEVRIARYVFDLLLLKMAYGKQHLM